MRGPGHKLALDVRRVWRCPACGYERRGNGLLTSIHCGCAAGPFMQLVDEPRFDRLQNRPLDTYVDASELLGDEEDPVVETNASNEATASDERSETAPAIAEDEVADEPTDGDAENVNVPSDESEPVSEDAESATSPEDESAPIEVSAEQQEPPRESNGGRNRRRRRGRGPRGPKPPTK